MLLAHVVSFALFAVLSKVRNITFPSETRDIPNPKTVQVQLNLSFNSFKRNIKVPTKKSRTSKLHLVHLSSYHLHQRLIDNVSMCHCHFYFRTKALNGRNTKVLFSKYAKNTPAHPRRKMNIKRNNTSYPMVGNANFKCSLCQPAKSCEPKQKRALWIFYCSHNCVGILDISR